MGLFALVIAGRGIPDAIAPLPVQDPGLAVSLAAMADGSPLAPDVDPSLNERLAHPGGAAQAQ